MIRSSRSRNKYNATAVEIDGIKFDSKREAARYQDLKLLQQAGKISDLYFHRRWPLYAYQVANVLNGSPAVLSQKLIGHYESDFDYTDLVTLESVIEDYKGFETDIFKWKWKHMQAQYPDYSFRIVK